MNACYEKLKSCFNIVREKIDFKPRVALVLGSGLGGLADEILVHSTLDYSEIEGFPVSTVPGHKGRFVFGYIDQTPVVIMQGRVHFYEGYDIADVVLPIRLMKLMGAEKLFLTNACGGINQDFYAGCLMLLTDHISLFVPSPLAGENIGELGTRFPDMSEVYDKSLRNIIRETAKEQKIDLKEGVYVQLSGPNFETPAEILMCRAIGADAVGMSTSCEAMAAKHMGMEVCGISCVANMACGMTDQPLSHEEVQEMAAKAAPLFKNLLKSSISKM